MLDNFVRVTLKPGESKRVTMKMRYEDLTLINSQLEEVVEPGDFEVMIGASSRDEDLLKALVTVPVLSDNVTQQ